MDVPDGGHVVSTRFCPTCGERRLGKLIRPTDVPGVVHFALFEDPAGNKTGLIQ